MNKTDFIVKLSEELGVTKTEANKNFEAVIKCIAHAMKDNDELRFTGFGSFKAKQTEAKEVKTPKGTIAKVPAQRRISFSVGSDFKAIVNNK
jgi:nucleoid DNA-binding protein